MCSPYISLACVLVHGTFVKPLLHACVAMLTAKATIFVLGGKTLRAGSFCMSMHLVTVTDEELRPEKVVMVDDVRRRVPSYDHNGTAHTCMFFQGKAMQEMSLLPCSETCYHDSSVACWRMHACALLKLLSPCACCNMVNAMRSYSSTIQAS